MNSRRKSVCLLGVSLRTGNLGVSALAAGTVTSVVNCFPEAEVFMLDYGREPGNYCVQGREGEVAVRLINIRFSKKFFLQNNIARLLATAIMTRLLPNAWRQRCLKRNPYLRAILDTDIIASLAGGDSFSDIYGLGRLLYVALPQILVLKLGKRLILLPQTLGPFKSSTAKFIARFVLRHAHVVYSRDRMSINEVKSLLGDEADKVRFSYDMAFVLEPVPPAEFKLAGFPQKQPDRPLVGINVSGLLYMGGYSRDNMFGLRVDYRRVIREIIACFIDDHGADVVLIPHVNGDDEESDTAACARVYQEFGVQFPKRLHLLTNQFNQHEIKYVIGRCDFFLGARMHACIAALSQSIPAACMAYSRKFAGVLEAIGCRELVVDLCALETTDVMKAVNQIFGSRREIRQMLRATIPGVQEHVRNLFSHCEGIQQETASESCRPRDGKSKLAGFLNRMSSDRVGISGHDAYGDKPADDRTSNTKTL